MERCEKNKAQFVSLIGVRFEFDGMIAQTPASRVNNAYSAEIRRVLLAANAQENGLACAVGADPSRREQRESARAQCADSHLEGKHKVASFIIGVLGLNIGGDLVTEFIENNKSTLSVL